MVQMTSRLSRRIIKLAIFLTCLAILIHDVGSGRFSVFRYRFGLDDVNKQLWEAIHRGDVGACSTSLRKGAGVADLRITLSRSRETQRGAPVPNQPGAYHILFAEKKTYKLSRQDWDWGKWIDCTAEVAGLLVDYGARPNLDAAIGLECDLKRRGLVAECLSKRGRVRVLPSPMHAAAKENNWWCVPLLLAAGADVNERDRGIPLDEAVRRGNYEVAAVLLEHGAFVSGGDRGGETPLHAAAWAGHVRVAQLLIENGANVSARTGVYGRCDGAETPLHSAAFGGRERMCKLLIQKGANVNALTRDCSTALDLARKEGHEEVVALLRAHGGRSWLPMSEAIRQGDSIAVSDLCKTGKYAVPGNDEWTPLHLAAFLGQRDVCEALITTGASVNARCLTDRGTFWTPLECAVAKKHPEAAALLRKHGGKRRWESASIPGAIRTVPNIPTVPSVPHPAKKRTGGKR